MIRRTANPLAAAAMILAVASALHAQSLWKVPDHIKNYTMFVKSPVFPDLKDAPGVPRALLIGDSISMQYGPETRRLLEGKATVYHIPDNGQTTKYGLEQLQYWLGDGHWTVIHFNFGLHDIHAGAGHKPQVSIEDYERNLREIVKRLQATGAKLVWASTTPVPAGITVRSESDVVAYNEVARKIMDENHIPINDLHALAESWGAPGADWQLPHNVHFRAEGYAALAAQVAKYIDDALHR